MSPTKVTQKTAVVYVRTSTSGQKEAATIEAQVERCGTLVHTHGVQLLPYGAKRDGWIRDDGVSGSLLEGRAFAKLIDDLEHGRVRVDYLVVYSMSRLARHDKSSKEMAKLVKSATDKARIMAVLNGAGVKVIDQDGINDPASVMTEIKETLSGEEYRGIRQKTMDGKARVLANGAWATGGRVPYGYARVPVNGTNKRQGTTLAAHAVDGPRFVQLMEWFISGGVTHAARKAMEAGWPAPRGGKEWYPSTLQQILNNVRAYLGESTLTISGQQFDVSYPALVDAQTYARIERRRKETTLSKRTTFLSTGHVDCSCGRHVNTHRSGTRATFYTHCRGRCGTHREADFSARLWELVVARLVQIKERETANTKGKDPFGAPLTAAKASLAKTQTQLDRLVALYAEGAMDKAALTTNTEVLRAKKATLQAEVMRLDADRQSHAQKKVGEETVQSRIQVVLKKLRGGRVPLDGKRRVLSDLLQGERVVLTWRKGKPAYAAITLPAFGDLPPVTVRIDQDITTQIHGVRREVLDVYYQADDAVEDVAL